LSRQEDDLEQSILCLTEAIFLPLPQDTYTLNVVQIFHFLTLTILSHVKHSWQPEDIKCFITYLRYLHGRWREAPNVLPFLPFTVTSILVHALAIQVELELEDAARDIEEMADLCDELLDFDTSESTSSSYAPVMVLLEAVNARLAKHTDWQWQLRPPYEKVMECLRKANVRLPDSHRVSIILEAFLWLRYTETPSDDILQEGMAILDKIINFRGSEDKPSPYREEALMFSACFNQAQFSAYGKPEHLEQTIGTLCNWIDETSLENPLR